MGCRPAVKYSSGSVITWYRRPPTIPKGTAHSATSSTSSARRPWAAHRLRVIHAATTMPRRMHSA
jgi:hypothetical protein